MAGRTSSARGRIRTWMGGFLGLIAGGLGVYFSTIIEYVAKPSKPVANFAVSSEGLKVTCLNHASGQSGWWDFGDGTPLEPFESDKPSVVHLYSKPGNYAVKLLVRNFLQEESERVVPVELAGSAAASSTPTIASFQVEPVGGALTAPATFRVRGEVANVDRIIWDLGTDRLEVTEPTPGPIEKLVVFEKPGPYQLQVIGYAGKQAVKRAEFVQVVEPKLGTLSALIRYTDTGTRVDKLTSQESIAIPLPAKGVTQFERTIAARPGYTIVQAKLASTPHSSVKNLRVEILPDRRTAKLSGEWSGSADAVRKTLGSDLIVPVRLDEEQTSPLPGRTQVVATQFQTVGSLLYTDGGPIPLTAILPVPPAPKNVINFRRKLDFEIREITTGQQSRSIGALADLKPPFQGTVVNLAGRQHLVDIRELPTGQLRVSLTPR